MKGSAMIGTQESDCIPPCLLEWISGRSFPVATAGRQQHSM